MSRCGACGRSSAHYHLFRITPYDASSPATSCSDCVVFVAGGKRVKVTPLVEGEPAATLWSGELPPRKGAS